MSKSVILKNRMERAKKSNERIFSKYEGTGNDFILIDDRDRKFPISSEKISTLCHRRYGIGTDGLILLQPSTAGDFSMRIFNQDGSEAEMCGNGLRCLIQFLSDLGVKKRQFSIETRKKIYSCAIKNGSIYVAMGVPKILEKKGLEVLLEVGVPHFVTFVDELSRFDREAKEHFSVIGVNINYARVESLNTIHMRTFERGVEEETFSCGSGATAVCMAAWTQFGITGSVKVIFGSGEKLQFEMLTENQKLKGITMIGRARHIFDGKIRL
ncbi:MAG: diaminopimelate epimerase [Simkaniaceae bacterium]|nr:diaminopimelate epimerase [Simkaniaceae bacterium]